MSETPEHRALALKAAREAIILLKNENNAVPLDRTKIRSIAVIGPNAGSVNLGEYSGGPTHKVSILDGIKEKVGKQIKVNYAEGCKITEGDPKTGQPNWSSDDVKLSNPAENAKKIVEAVNVARASDVAIVVVGDNVETAREGYAENHLGDRDSLDLIGQQNDLVKAIVETGKPTILILDRRQAAVDQLRC